MRCNVQLSAVFYVITTMLVDVASAPHSVVQPRRRRTHGNGNVKLDRKSDRRRILTASGYAMAPPPRVDPRTLTDDISAGSDGVSSTPAVHCPSISSSGRCDCSAFPLVVRCRGRGASAALRDVVAGFQVRSAASSSSTTVVVDELRLTDVDAVVDVLRRRNPRRQHADGRLSSHVDERLRVRRLLLRCGGAANENGNDDSSNDEGDDEVDFDERNSGLESRMLAAGLVSAADLEELTTTGCRLRHDVDGDDEDGGRPPTPIFAALPRLRILRVRSAGLESISFDSPETTASGLRELELWGNRIATLDDRSFAGLYGLVRLDLDRNRIAEIRRRTWTGLVSLETLRLSGNRLATLPDRAFADLPRLRALSVDRNALGFLHPAALRGGLDRLVVLRLADNRIPFVADGAFSELTALRRLDLSGNRLDRVWAGTFAGLRSLEWIDLSRNRLGRVPDGSFRQSPELGRIRLDWNRLTSGLGRCALAHSSSSSSYSASGGALRSVSLLGNPMHCDCRMAWLAASSSSSKAAPAARRSLEQDGGPGDDGGGWKTTTVWGHCLTNGSSQGESSPTAVGSASSYEREGCPMTDGTNECERH